MIELYIQEHKKKIHTQLTEYIREYFADDDKSIPWLEDSMHRILPFALSGKCIRGSLFILSCAMLGETITQSHYRVAGGLELFHSALLIHDDIIDNDFMRRDKKTLFAQYMDIAENEHMENPREFGNSMGICIGDMSLFLSFSMIGTAVFPAEVQSQLIRCFASEAYKVGCGQMQDIYLSRHSGSPLKETIYSVYIYKTARYTFSLPFLLGAVITKQDAKIQYLLIQLGQYIGLIFQIRDDALRYFKLQDHIGKDVGSDIRENTKTIYRHLLYERSTIAEKRKLNTIFGNPHAVMDDFFYVEKCMYKKHICEDIEQEIATYKKESLHIIDLLPIQKQDKQLLTSLVTFVYNRNK